MKLVLKLSKAGKKQLAKKGKVKVTARVSYTPTGGTARSQNRAVTFKKT